MMLPQVFRTWDMGRACPGGSGRVPGTRVQIFEVDLFGISVKNWASYVFLYKYDWAYGPAPFGLVRPTSLIYIGNWIRLISFHWKLWEVWKVEPSPINFSRGIRICCQNLAKTFIFNASPRIRFLFYISKGSVEFCTLIFLSEFCSLIFLRAFSNLNLLREFSSLIF